MLLDDARRLPPGRTHQPGYMGLRYGVDAIRTAHVARLKDVECEQ